jgi:hypothetical protein
MRLVAKFVAATCVVSALGITASVGPAAAQMWDWNNRTQYGPNYDNYGPRYGAPGTNRAATTTAAGTPARNTALTTSITDRANGRWIGTVGAEPSFDIPYHPPLG